MAVIISVVSGGSVAQVQQLGSEKNGVARISAIGGARYVLADTQGGGAAADVTVKRVGKNLVIGRGLDGAEQEALIIEDYYGSGGQLVAQAADGSYQDCMAVTDGGAVDAAQMGDGASSALTLVAAQPAVLAGEFQFSEGGSSLFGSALASAAVVAGGIALSTGRDGGGKASAAPAASALVLEDRLADVATGQPTPAMAGEGVVATVNGVAVSVDSNAAVESGENSAAEAVSASGSNGAVATVAPFAVDDIPVIEKVMDDYGLIQGVIENGGYTDDGYPTIMGKAEPGVKVHIYRNNYLLNYVVADANGEWSYTSTTAFTSGKHSITIVHEYPNKEISEPSAPYVITVDRIPPAIPVITGIVDDVGRITGAITDQTITDDNRPAINGKAEAHAKVIVYDKGKEIGSTTAGADGKWSFTPDIPLADGVHMLSYSALDRAGNSSQQTAVTEFFVDTRPEKINMYYADDNVGSVTGEVFSGGVTDDSTPTLFGTATAGGIVKIYEGSVLLGQVTADVDGTWQFTPSAELSEGAHTFHATVTLVAKGESDRSKPFNLEVDITAPAKPTIDQVWDDVGSQQGAVADGGMTDDDMPTLTGKAEANTTVVIYDNGVEIGRVLVNGSGAWRFTPDSSMSYGEHQLSVKAVDKAGNASEASNPHHLFINHAPTTVDQTIQGDEDESINGKVVANDVDGNTLSYTIESGNGPAHGTVTLDSATGGYIYTPNENYGGSDSFTVTVSDGHGGTANSVVTVNVVPVADAPLLEPALVGVVIGKYLDGKLITSNAKPVAELEKILGVNAGALNIFDPPAGPINHAGKVIVYSGAVDTQSAYFNAGSEVGFSWKFTNGENVDIQITSGRNDLVALIVTNPAGEKQFILITSSEQLGASVNGQGVYKYSPTVSGNYRFDWLVLDGGDTAKNSSLSVTPNFTAGEFPNGGVAEISLKTALVDLDGSETLSVRISSVPAGASFSAGTNNGDGSWTFTEAQLTGLKFYAPVGYTGAVLSLVVTATATESGNGSTASTTSVLKIGLGLGASVTIDSVGQHSAGVELEVTDGAAGQVVSGKLSSTLASGIFLQVSVDGGQSWQNAVVHGQDWAFIDTSNHTGNWTIQTRISDGVSHVNSPVTQAVTLIEGPGAPTITSIPEAESIYTSALAQNGSEMTVSLAGTGAKVGDKVHIQWGSSTYDQVLTLVNVTTGSVTLNVPAAVTYSTASYAYDFAVTAQIIGKDGALGAVSMPYDVVGTYTRALVSDTLQLAPTNNVYTGTGVTVTTTGTMAKTAATANSLAGLTLSDTLQANAKFTLTKPADQITLRLSGADNALGAKIHVYDTQGKLMFEQTVFGGATAQHYVTFTWTKTGLADIGSFTVTAMSASVTLDSFSQYAVTHTKDARDANLIDILTETFYGSSGSDVVSMSQYAQTYFAQATAAVHGGSGIDTLKLVGAGHVLNLTTAGSKISSMEVIDLTGSGNNTLTLNLSDVLRNGGTDLFYTGDKSRVQMMVTGKAGDSVNLSDLLTGGIDHGDWVKTTVVVIDGVNYNSYQHSSLDVELLVKKALTVTVTNSTAVGAVNAVGAQMSAHLLEDAGIGLFESETHAPAVAVGQEEVGYQKHSYSLELPGLHDFRLEAY